MELTNALRLPQEELLKNKFNNIYGKDPEYKFLAPARINLIGEHIDYNGGHVLPACVSLYLTLYVSKRNDKTIRLYSTSFDKTEEFNIKSFIKSNNSSWTDYIKGAISILQKHGYNIESGFDLLYDSTIPVGSSLSSSAALLDVTLYMLSSVLGFNIDKKNIALYAKEVENNYLGLSCGIMDQAIIALGKKNTAMMLDCAHFEYKYINLDLKNYRFVILNTNRERKLTESKYNERVLECNKGLDIIKTKYNVNNLCELTPFFLDDIKELINDELIYKRVKHVISEESRVSRFAKSLSEGDIISLGEILNESHESLKKDYEVSGFYLDTICEEARKAHAVGARMTGAGFSGCAIALIDKDIFENFKKEVKENYYKKTNLKCDVLLVDITAGVN